MTSVPYVMRCNEDRSNVVWAFAAISRLRNEGVVGSRVTRYRSIASPMRDTLRSVTLTTVPRLAVIARIVLKPPKWSNMRKGMATTGCRTLRNLFATRSRSCRMPLGLPVDPDENKISPGAPVSTNRSSRSLSTRTS